VLDGNPLHAPVRTQIALVALHPALPEALCVREILALSQRLRGDVRVPALESLSALGLEALEPKLGRSLTPDEGRAVLLAAALGSSRVRVLLVEEPGVRVEPRAARRLGAALREFTRDGRVVVMVTSSARDAEGFAEDTWQLRAGRLRGPCSPTMSSPLEPSTAGASLRVLVSDSRVLAAALTRESHVEGVTYDDGGLRVHGANALALAEAVGRAIVATEVDVFELRLETGDVAPPSSQPRDASPETKRPSAEAT
jgi:energy-coupling factor transporter ATP-binding protein EcfA2